jgi:nucleobase:cation symporter-1, NCS1 family
VTVFVSIIGTVTLIAFIERDHFAHDFDNWLASVVVWISAWSGVMLIDYFLFRRGRVDVDALYADPQRSIYGDVNWAAVIAAIAGLVAGWAWEYGLVGFMQGPLAKATNNTDISWLTAFVVSGGLYYILRPILAPREAPQAAVTH